MRLANILKHFYFEKSLLFRQNNKKDYYQFINL